jgi:hypothetical protein
MASNARESTELPESAPPPDHEWDRLLAAPRRVVRSLTSSDIDARPGVYLWRHGGRVAYVGKAKSLRDRIWKRHLGGSRSLGGSSLRRNVCELLLGIPTSETLRGRRKMTPEEVSTIREWLRECEIAWVTTESEASALALEKRLRLTWMPPLNRI